MQFPTHLTAKRFMTDSGPVLTSYFGGRDLPGSSTEHGCHMLSAFLTWYNIPHPKALRQMGLQGLHSEPLIYSLSNIYLKEKEKCSDLDTVCQLRENLFQATVQQRHAVHRSK